MTPPWKIYENLKEIVYVIDVENYELVYINKFGREKLGYRDNEGIKGKFCYKVLQNLSEPCSFCPNSQLKLGEFYEWKYYNPVLKNKYILKDTLIEYRGKTYKMELTINETGQELDKSNPELLLHNEIIIKEFLKEIHSFADVDEAIESALKFLGEVLDGERAYIFEENIDGTLVSNTYEWCKGGIKAEKENLQNLSKESVISWYEMFWLNENMIIKNIEDIKDKYVDLYNILYPQNIKSLVVSPLMYKNDIIGFFGVDNPPKEKFEYISKVLSILSHFLVSTLKRRDLVKELHFLSCYDQLTGAKNRNALNKFLNDMKSVDSLGILFGDVTGLKKINDTFGHVMGDRLLQTAYNYIESVFKEYEIYRVGGDEFLVLCENIEKDNFVELSSLLKRKIAESEECKIAFGELWTSNKTDIESINNLIDRADKLMYVAKKRYYEELNIKSWEK